MTDFEADSLSTQDRRALLRWRLALGSGAERAAQGLSLEALGVPAGASEAAVDAELSAADAAELDEALDFVYGEQGDRRRGGGPYVPRWLGAVRRFFNQDAVALLQKDAIEKKGLTRLLFEPETMPLLEKNVELVAMLLSARGLVPDEAKETARQIVREVVEELRRRLETEVRSAVYGALRRDRHSPLKLLRNLDWRRTIRSNLKGWDAERRRLVPERFHFWANQRRRHEWDVVIVVDQSGSMAVSCVYASIMASIFASLDVLRTRMVLYDTEVVDVTELLSDPVEVLFTAQLGGGNDGKRALAYVQERYVERPEKTLFLWITDLGEPHEDFPQLVGRMRHLVESRAKAFFLLARDEGGRPWYDRELARQLTEVGVLCFGCTPKRLVEVMERALKGQDVAALVSTVGS